MQRIIHYSFRESSERRSGTTHPYSDPKETTIQTEEYPVRGKFRKKSRCNLLAPESLEAGKALGKPLTSTKAMRLARDSVSWRLSSGDALPGTMRRFFVLGSSSRALGVGNNSGTRCISSRTINPSTASKAVRCCLSQA